MKPLIKERLSLLIRFAERIILMFNIYKTANAHRKIICSKKLLYEHKKYWKRLSRIINTTWYKVYKAISGIEDIRYVPEDIYYLIIEPRLNKLLLAAAYSDKNFYDKTYNSDIFPVCLIRNIQGIFYDKGYNRIDGDILKCIALEQKVLIKPSLDSGGGHNVAVFEKTDKGFVNPAEKAVLSLKYLQNKYKSNFVVQRYIEQHAYFRQFNPESLNTIRLITYRSVLSEEVVILAAVLKFSRNELPVDNFKAGGYCCSINSEGILNDYAFDSLGNKIYSFSKEKMKFCEMEKIYRFQDMVKLVIGLAKNLYYFRVVGFDVSIDKEHKIRLVEINTTRLDINMVQFSNGSLFKQYTDEVVRYCLQS